MPFKRKTNNGLYGPFMTEELSKAIMEKSKTRNKWSSREDYVSYKKSKIKCNSLTENAKKDWIMSNKKIWSAVKPFLKTRCISNDYISVDKDGDLISNEKELVELFNQNYTNSGTLLRKETFITCRLFKCFSR